MRGTTLPIYVYEPTIWSVDEKTNDCCSFEVLQSFKDAPFKQCPVCGHAIHRAITSFSMFNHSSNSQDTKASENYLPSSNGKKNESPSAKVAKLAMRHICRSGCSH